MTTQFLTRRATLDAVDLSALFDEKVAIAAQSAQLRVEAARLRGEIHRSRDELHAAAQSALLAAETVRAQLEHARICGTARTPCLQHSLVERLQARLSSLPAIEQAKGMLMARQGCDADQAFDILRRASQRTNVPVREIAKQMAESQWSQPGRSRQAPHPT